MKRSFPRIVALWRDRDVARLRKVMWIGLRLNNFRTRGYGGNQLKTTFMRHVNANFRDQLREARRLGGEAGLNAYVDAAQTSLEAEEAALGDVADDDDVDDAGDDDVEAP